MAINRVDFGGNTLIDLSGDTLESAEQLLKGIIAHAKDGSVITGLMEAGGGGGPSDHMGYPVVTGEITFASDMTSSYKLEFAEGNRLRVKTKSGFLNQPFFILTESVSEDSSVKIIKYIVVPTYGTDVKMPKVYAFINAYHTSTSSYSSTYMQLTGLTWEKTADSVNSRDGSDIIFTSVTIPCSSNIKFGAGCSYRYVVAAPWGYDIDTVEVV